MDIFKSQFLFSGGEIVVALWRESSSKQQEGRDTFKSSEFSHHGESAPGKDHIPLQ